MRQSLTGGVALPVALNQLLHPADQLLPHVVKQQVEDGLTAAAVRRDGRETAGPASRLGTVLLTLVVPDGNKNNQSNKSNQGTERTDFSGSSAEMTHKSLLSKARYSSIRPSASITVGFS